MFKLGKHPKRHVPYQLKLANYALASMPAPPAAANWGAAVPDYPMFGNDTRGDCTCAAIGHMVQVWTANAGRLVTPAENAIINLYEHFNPFPMDNGCNCVDVLNYLQTTGLEIGGVPDKIAGYVAVDVRDLDEVRTSVSLFGALYLGIALPDAAVRCADMLAFPWESPCGDANPQNGHCVPVVAYTPASLFVVTWGRVKEMSWSFFKAYAEEGYAVTSRDWVGRFGTPAGLDFDELLDDCAEFQKFVNAGASDPVNFSPVPGPDNPS